MFEFKVESFTVGKGQGALQDHLNGLGREGWQMVGHLNVVTNAWKKGVDGYTIILQREWVKDATNEWVLR